MLRTIATGTHLAKRSETIVKVVRATFTRTITVECAKRRLHQTYTFRRNQPVVQRQLQWYYQIRHYASNLPAHIRVTLPALSPTMENGTIVSWEKKEGDKLNEGDLLAEIETDKATMGFETPEEGYLAKILIPAGTKGVPIGKLVCIIVESEADVAAFKDFKDDGAAAAVPAPAAPAAPAPAPSARAAPAAAAAAPAAPAPPAPAPPPPQPPAGDSGRVYASPMAKRLAEQRNIRLQGKGTGLYGSITSGDLDKLGVAAAEAPTPTAKGAPKAVPKPGATFVDIPLTSMRTVIAKRLLQSKQTTPHYYITVDVNVDKVLALRSKFNKKLDKVKVKLTINDFVVKASALACRSVREANSAWMETFIREFHNVDISIAVATDKGLLTPIVFNADNKGIVDINKEVKSLAQKAKEGKLQPHEFQGGTFSISNLGMFGVSHFCAIINPPQSCILAIGGTQQRLVAADNDKGFKVANFMSVTLSADHRIVDGAVGARWLQAFRENLEDPENMIL